MNKAAIPFLKYVEKTLNPYKWGVSLLASLVTALFFSSVLVMGQIDSNRQILATLSPYTGNLARASDRPEILRVLENAASTTNSEVVLVKDGLIFATSGNPQALDQQFSYPNSSIQLLNAKITNGKIVLSEAATGGTQLFIYSELAPIVQKSFGVFVFTFFTCIALAAFSSFQMQSAIRRALLPMAQLQTEIENLSSCEVMQSNPIAVEEIEAIRQRLLTAKLDLENAKDKLAEEKAKKLSANAYKQLIHDLHNPVSALRLMVKVASDSELSYEGRAEAFLSLPRIADQILGQVTAAKRNLEEEPVSLREGDLAVTVKESIQQISITSKGKSILSQNVSEIALVPHDTNLLKRAVVNLLENAIHASRSRIRVSIQKTENTTSIYVCDDGEGMDEALVPLYFQGRGRSSKANRQAFGLSSTSHIVKSHGGKLIYRKSEWGGSSFEIRLEGAS